MAQIELPYFGQINYSQLEQYYTVKVNELNIKVDLNFVDNNINEEEALNVKVFLENILTFNTINKKEILNDFNNEGETQAYINFYLEELTEEELKEIIGYDDESLTLEEQLLNQLRLVRVGIYPDKKFGINFYSVFDYSIYIDGEACNQVLAVKTNRKGELDCIDWES